MNEARLLSIPIRQIGQWRIEHRVVTKQEASFGHLRAAINGHGRYTPAGIFVGLLRGKVLVMSNVPDELRDLLPLKTCATGHVLIAGLGLGCAVDVVLEKAEVTRITVIEQSPEVIALVGPSFTDPRVEIICGDIFTWAPPKGIHYGAAWFDIWDSICADNLPGMARLHRRFARRAKWKGSWCWWQCKRYA